MLVVGEVRKMKLNKNKVLSALTAKEEKLKAALVAAEAADLKDLQDLVQVRYVQKLTDHIDHQQKAIADSEACIRRLKAKIKVATHAKTADLSKLAREARNYTGEYQNCAAKSAKQALQHLQKQKALAKLADGETIDSKAIDLDLEVL